MKPFVIAILAVAGLTTCACSGGSGGASRPTNTITVTAPATSPAASATTQPVISAPSASTSSSGTAAAAGCLSRYLNGSTGLEQGTAGAVMVEIVFKNLDNVPCTLYGFPGVAQAAGTPVTDVGHPSTENPSTARELVTLQPGGYANATLRITDAGNFPASACTQVKATWLAVIPPNQTIPLYISYPSTACKGSAELLMVTTVAAGNGG